MADARQTARSSSNRARLNSRCAPRPTYPPPLTKGAWVANRYGARQIRHYNFPDSLDQTNYLDNYGIILPHRHATIEQPDTERIACQDQEHNTIAEVEPKTSYEIEGPAELPQDNATELFPPVQDQLSQCHLYRLPNEILDQIFTLLVITGGVYQFTPVVGGLKMNPDGISPFICVKPEDFCNELVTSIHFVHAPAEGELERPPLQLALVSSRIREIVYRIFYGQNQFVNEVAGRPLTSHVEVDDDLVLRTRHPTGDIPEDEDETRTLLFDTWCRLYPPTVQGLVGPLSINILRYVSNLTICIVPDTDSSSPESKIIRQQLERIASAFSGDEERALKKLTITFETLQPFVTNAKPGYPGRYRYLTDHLCIKRAEGADGLEMVADGVPIGAPYRSLVGHVCILTGVMKRDSVEFQKSVDCLQDVLEPLSLLEGFLELDTDSEIEVGCTTDGEESEDDGSEVEGSEDDESNDEELEDDASNGDEANVVGPNGDEPNGYESDDLGSRSPKRQRISC